MNIVADRNIPLVTELFQDFGTVTLVDGRALGPDQLKHADVLLVRSVTQVNRDLLDESAVRFVGSATAGYDHIDLAYLAGRGIPCALASGANADSVVEYVLAAICLQPQFLQTLFKGGTLGIVGYGHVGRRLAEAAQILGANTKVFDPYVDCGHYASSLDDVLACDVISLHCELSKTGRFPSWHLLDKKRLDGLHHRQLVINAARGGVIDNHALRERLLQPDAPTVVLDCWEGEPAIDEALVPLVAVATPHIAGYSYDAKVRGTSMLRQAVACHLGFEIDTFRLTNDSHLKLRASIDVCSGLSDLLANVYCIEIDDANLRSAMREARPMSGAHWFDQLRRDYPIRRELRGTRVHAEVASEAVQRLQQCFQLQLSGRNC
jgi:erythronate-4-phosphate dehydrogenase